MAKRPRGLNPPVNRNQRRPVLDPPQLDPETEALEAEISEILGEDDGPPSGAHHGETHTRRGERAEALARQGPKTRAANRERVKGSRLFNPR